MINDTSRLMNDMNVITSVLSPDVDEVKMKLRLEEVLNNYEIHRKTETQIEDDFPEKVEMFLSARELEGLSAETLKGYLIELRMFNKFTKKATVQITTLDIRQYLASNKSWMVGTVDN
ncbi:hypothetical protein CIL05_06725 [Virgibacillus profundi]|uniref:Integrase SAM-like N-terminal domain-containing protein n=1 Tax=Virgibacillus profundi TaxID=2024555 RepID=A0A2A2IG99_9BACI|nr:phage integrase N-terminal SAM-like domain-containing protein [Virgibacillus profundi]PAV30155.1 hypothetical protein CIL05_06725 [Virgibacillus profundi]PXY54327.1 hypothetical protein CIT14_06810 [Virgibacillus profundi]